LKIFLSDFVNRVPLDRDDENNFSDTIVNIK